MANRLLGLFAVLSLITPTLATAQDDAEGGETTTFTAKGKNFEVAVPDALCLPQTQTDEEATLLLAALDPDNETSVTMGDCTAFFKHYALIKYPKNLPEVPFSKPVFLRFLARSMETEAVKKELDKAKGDASQDVSEGTNGAVEISQGDIVFSGSDDECVYLSGQLQVEGFGQTDDMLIATCMTLVGQIAFAVHTYIDTDRSTDVDGLKNLARTIATSIAEKPAAE